MIFIGFWNAITTITAIFQVTAIFVVSVRDNKKITLILQFLKEKNKMLLRIISVRYLHLE